VEEFFLGRFLAADELHVIDHQHVHGTELFLEINGILFAQRPDEPVHELFRRQIDDGPVRCAFADVPGDGLHQMGLAEADAAIKEQRIENHLRGFGDTPGGGVGKLVWLADDELLEDMETRLLMADVGIEATTMIMETLQQRVTRRQVSSRKALYRALQDELEALLAHVAKPLEIDSSKKPYVILVVGVNGVGKTTTIGKLAKRLQGEGKQVMLAAGDTFRAAAVEQLQVWGERNQIGVIAQHTGADSASVIFDGLQAAKARGADVLIADTAGRLHNKDHLMDELAKVKRVMAKLDPDAPHEVMLVLDAGTGQNAISQTKLFDQAVGLTGLTLTKLDGTAKGGVIFALAKQFGLPIRFIGVGEQIDDLRPFTAPDFVAALFGQKP